jgi:peptide chain release factor 1
MIDRLLQLKQRYDKISEMLMDPAITKDMHQLKTLSKEQRGLEEVVGMFARYQNVIDQLQSSKEMLKDADREMRALAQAELEELEPQRVQLEEQLERLLIPKDPNDERDVIMEIRGAAGGDEANIFAGDLYRMYVKFGEHMGWSFQLLDSEESASGGFSRLEVLVSGDHVYSNLKYESGAHRVQRVPETESQGRIHTSTATVLVMPEAEEIEINLDMNDVRIDTFTSSGPGGQSVNTTKSAVRATHEPTGIMASCQDGKSQHENKASALKILKARLYDAILQERLDKEGAERRSKIGTGDRSEKVRTYNYPQNRVTDHRIGWTIQQLDRIMEGRLSPVIDALQAAELAEQLKAK